MDKILVRPPGDGWAVETPGADNPMVFRSGRAAEDAGKGLARRRAKAGETAELELGLRSGVCAGRFLCVPPAGEDDDVLPPGVPGLADRAAGFTAQGLMGNP